MTFEGWLAARMAERKLTQRQMAALSGLYPSTISRILRGSDPGLPGATRMFNALGYRLPFQVVWTPCLVQSESGLHCLLPAHPVGTHVFGTRKSP